MWARMEDTMWATPPYADAPLAALGLWVLLTSYSAQQHTAGVIPGPVFDRFFSSHYDALQAMLTAGLLHPLEDRAGGRTECGCLADVRANEGYYLHGHLWSNPRNREWGGQ